jgi:2-C-methyl-D-erythritol 4-phosphate cytidylyltransferase
MLVWAILAAAGTGSRMGRPKQLLDLAGTAVAARSLDALAAAQSVGSIVVVCEEELIPEFERIASSAGGGKVQRVVCGGASRQDSVAAGLRAVVQPVDVVVVHDGARPFAGATLVEQVVERARAHGGAIAAVAVKDTIKQATESGFVHNTVPRERLWAAQTPQAFAYDVLVRAHAQAEADGFLGTDDAELVERLGGAEIAIVEGSYENLKITTPEDLVVAERLAARLGVA